MPSAARTTLNTDLAALLASGQRLPAAVLRQGVARLLDYADAVRAAAEGNAAAATQALAPQFVHDSNTQYRSTAGAVIVSNPDAALYRESTISYIAPDAPAGTAVTYRLRAPAGKGLQFKLYATGGDNEYRGPVGLTVNGDAVAGVTQRQANPNADGRSFAYYASPVYPAGTPLTLVLTNPNGSASTVYFEDDGVEILAV